MFERHTVKLKYVVSFFRLFLIVLLCIDLLVGLTGGDGHLDLIKVHVHDDN